MTRRRKNPLRPLTEEERAVLEKIGHAQSEPASHVARAQALLRVANGATYAAATELVGHSSGYVVAQWVARFDLEWLAALEPGQWRDERDPWRRGARTKLGESATSE